MIASDYPNGLFFELEDYERDLMPEFEAVLQRVGLLYLVPRPFTLFLLCTGETKEKIKKMDCWEFAEWQKGELPPSNTP